MQSGKWIVQLEPGVWVADIEGDPGRTVVRDNAKRFRNLVTAGKAVTAARKYRPFKGASIDSAPYDTDHEGLTPND